MQPAEVTKLRESLGMTIAEFAEALEVDFSTVWRWEAGARNPDRPYVRLMQILRTQRTLAHTA